MYYRPGLGGLQCLDDDHDDEYDDDDDDDNDQDDDEGSDGHYMMTGGLPGSLVTPGVPLWT